jgi:Mn2+/Fe2+ NRAMP family transporter
VIGGGTSTACRRPRSPWRRRRAWAFILGFTYQTYIIKGAATALYNLAGRPGDTGWGVFLVAVVLVGLTVVMLQRGRQYRTLEIVARISVIALVVTFLVAVALRGFDPLDLLRGLAFQLPGDAGAFSASVITASIIGAVGGSAANLLYPYFMVDKGWRGPAFRKMQRFDLFSGILAMIVINMAIWILAAETLSGRGVAIETADDLASMMQQGIGPIGPILMWIGMFFVTFNSFPAYSNGFARILLDSLRHTFPRVARPDEDVQGHSSFRWIQIGLLLLLPLPFSLPMAPDFVALAVTGTALSALTAPIIIIGIILLTSRRRYMLDEYTNRWWETLALLVIGAIGLWATYGVIASFFA